MHRVRDGANCAGTACDSLSRAWWRQRGLGKECLVFLFRDASKGVLHESIAIDV